MSELCCELPHLHLSLLMSVFVVSYFLDSNMRVQLTIGFLDKKDEIILLCVCDSILTRNTDENIKNLRIHIPNSCLQNMRCNSKILVDFTKLLESHISVLGLNFVPGYIVIVFA